MMNFMYGEHKKESGSVVCPDDSCRIDPEKLRAAQARFWEPRDYPGSESHPRRNGGNNFQ